MNPFLILALAKGLFTFAKGKTQESEAKALEKENVRPTETVPQGALDATANAKLLASVGMPKEQYNQAAQQIDRSAANATASARDRRSSIDSVSTIQQASDDALARLGETSAKMRVDNTGRLITQENVMANWQDRADAWNKRQNFEENAAAIRGLKTAGNANENGALDSTMGTLLNMYAIGELGGSGKTPTPGGGTTGSTAAAPYPPINQYNVTGGYAANAPILAGGNPFLDPGTQARLYSGQESLSYLMRIRALQQASESAQQIAAGY